MESAVEGGYFMASSRGCFDRCEICGRKLRAVYRRKVPHSRMPIHMCRTCWLKGEKENGGN
jgi:ribosome-binding protein aMBF1 (putative translation factor)